MKPRLAAFTLLLPLLTIACATPAKPPAPAASQPKPATVEFTDGEYRGTTTRYQADSRACPHPGLVTLVVWDNRFQYRWDRETYVDATIEADGGVQGLAPGISLLGRLNGKRIEGDVTNGTCGLHFTVLKHS